MNDNDWQLQDNYREADCCENCVHAYIWSANFITCKLHRSDVADTMICNSFAREE